MAAWKNYKPKKYYTPKWWLDMSRAAREKYLKEHPNSKLKLTASGKVTRKQLEQYPHLNNFRKKK